MPENRADLLAHYHGMRAALLDAIAGLSDARLTERTLDGWSVKDHLLHLALWDELRAREIVRISAGFASALSMDPEQEAAFSRVGYELRRDLSFDQARWEAASTHEALLAAITNATERGLDGSHYREAGLRSDHEALHVRWIREWRAARGF